MSIRLNKYIADAGVTSRRGADSLIEAGRVKVNGRRITELGYKVDEKSKVEVDGETISTSSSKTYLALYKPRGVLSTMFDPDGRPSLAELVDFRKERLFHVGRLDKDSEGLILLTNDGDVTFRATHPSYGLEKTYLVNYEGELPRDAKSILTKGVELEDGIARVTGCKELPNNWVELKIHEGRYHIIRRLMDAIGVDVLRLVRSQFGPILLGDLKEGRWRDLNDVEVANLHKALAL
ncbi:MAG: rRNA pseudouridine synthase [Candidatus Nanopelagicaceae bacterium]|nr:rRNA pseudouridine synthase [Candidatus Nanopelagicaceae bacterium]